PRPVAAWCAALADVLARFLDGDGDDAEAAQVVRGALDRVADDAARADFGAAIPLDLVRALVRAELERPTPRGRFLAGGGTFCALVPMRTLPFEGVCLIGMNDGSLPRSRPPPSFHRPAAH